MNKVLVALPIAVSVLTGGLLALQARPGIAQNSAGVTDQRVRTLEASIVRLERRIRSLEGGSNARWRKIRDDGQRIVMIDSETGKVQIINTMNGTVRQPKPGK